MSNTEPHQVHQQQSMDNIPPLGYPTLNSPEGMKKKKGFFRTKNRGDKKGFIGGCLAALCCCWMCEHCF